jgi:hypothetical protein
METIQMRNFKKLLLNGSTFCALVACGDGSTSNPASADRNELAAPAGLVSVTHPSASPAIELRWNAANAEEDFKGYLVFGTTKALSGISSTAAFPAGAKDMLAQFGIPRCKDNSKFFESFGFAATDVDCNSDEDTAKKDDTASSLTADDADGSASADSAKTDDTEVLKNFLSCKENTGSSEKVSLEGKAPTTGLQKCTVSKVFNGTELVDIEPGTAMTFVVFAVMGDDYDKISWSSNYIEDAASTTLDGFDGKEIKLGLKEFVKIAFTVTDTAVSATMSDPATCPAGSFCKVSGINDQSNSEPAIYVGRDTNSSTHTQRFFVSVPEQGTPSQIELQARGAQTSTEGGTFSSSIPGDEPTGSYDATGTTFVIYGNQVFDFKITNGSHIKYGKIVFETVTYAGDKASDGTIKTTIIAQPGNDVMHYLW